MSHPLRSLSALAALAFVAACGSGETTISNNDTGAAADTTESSDTAADTDETPDTDDEDGATTDSGEGDDADTVTELLQPGEECTEDAECDTELCIGVAGEALRVCSSLCSSDSECLEGFDCLYVTTSGTDTQQVCVPTGLCVDGDGDGYGIGSGCEGPDCDDTNPDINPGADELCDNVDNDCDDEVDDNPVGSNEDCDTGFLGVCAAGRQVCSGGLMECESRVAPSEEVCDGLDNDCNGETDEGDIDARVWFADRDHDGYGSPTDTQAACEQPVGFVMNDGDCDDTNVLVNPDVTELCNGIDDECDGEVDEPSAADARPFYADGDGDGHGTTATVQSACSAPAGFVESDDDCNDAEATVYTGADEICDGLDNDCNGEVDDDATGERTWYGDADGDGYGNPAVWVNACTPPEGYVSNADDCNDGSREAYPGATEYCDGIDNNCVGGVDEATAADARTWYRDGDGDGYGSPTDTTVACYQPGGYLADNQDCRDTDRNVRPGVVELCNNVDDNCNGATDESLVRECTTACGAGTETCSAGSWTGCTAPPVETEVCDRLDNDCDGTIDDNIPGCRIAVYRHRQHLGGPYPNPGGTCPASADMSIYRYVWSFSTDAIPGWTYDPSGTFYAYAESAPGLSRLYQCSNADTGYFFLTRSSTCEDTGLTDPWPWSPGAHVWVAPNPIGDAIALGRMRHPGGGPAPPGGHIHIPGGNAAWLDHCHGYVGEGTSGYVWNNDGMD